MSGLSNKFTVYFDPATYQALRV